MAKEHGLNFMETSAKTNVNIKAAFIKLGEAILEKKKKGSVDREERLEDIRYLGRDGGGQSLCNICS